MITVSDKLKVWVEENPQESYGEMLNKLWQLVEEYLSE